MKLVDFKNSKNSIPSIKGSNHRLSSVNVQQLDTSNAEQQHKKEPLPLSGCENRWRRKEGVFHGHPDKREWLRVERHHGERMKSQRFRVVRGKVQEVRKTVCEPFYTRPHHPRLIIAPLLVLSFWAGWGPSTPNDRSVPLTHRTS